MPMPAQRKAPAGPHNCGKGFHGRTVFGGSASPIQDHTQRQTKRKPRRSRSGAWVTNWSKPSAYSFGDSLSASGSSFGFLALIPGWIVLKVNTWVAQKYDLIIPLRTEH